jgi:hypothetical protein
LLLLVIVDRVGGMARIMRRTSLYLDEDNRPAVNRDDIEFTAQDAVTSMKNGVALALEKLDSAAFAALAESLIPENPGFQSHCDISKEHR